MTHENINVLAGKAIVIDDISNEPTSVVQDFLRLQQQGFAIASRQEWCDVVLQRFQTELLSDAELLHGKFCLTQGTFQSRLKRLGDMALSVLLLELTSPLLIITSLLIKVEGGGPILYSQTRTWLDGIPYTIWKLRSMRIVAVRDGA